MSLAEQKLGKSNILGVKLDMLLAEFAEIKPHTYIEIGVFNCETFFKVVDTMNDPDDMFFGFDYFKDLVKDEFNREIAPHDPRYITFDDACLIALEKCKKIVFSQGNSKDTLYPTLAPHVDKMKSPICIFLDGGHSYETCYADMYYTWDLLKDKKDVYMYVDDLQFHSIKNAINDFIAMLKVTGFTKCEVKNFQNGLFLFRW